MAHRLLQVEGALHGCYWCVVSGVDIRDVLTESKGHPVSQKRALWAFRSSEGIEQETQEKGFIEEAGFNKGERPPSGIFLKTTQRWGFSTNFNQIKRTIALKIWELIFSGQGRTWAIYMVLESTFAFKKFTFLYI